MKGALSLVGLAVFVWIIWGLISFTSTGSHTLNSFGSVSPTNSSPSGACINAMKYAQQGIADDNAGDYSGAYKNASHGLRINDGCEVQEFDHLNAGYLLGVRAIAEHHLPQGDSRTDINQAITLLAECQTQPDFYGGTIGARCETQEEALISNKTNWEMENY